MTRPAHEPLFMAQPEELDMMRMAAQTYGQRGEFAEMEGVLDGLSLMEPSDPWIHATLGFARHRQGKLEQARSSYERALALSEKTDAVTGVNLVAVLLMLGENESAITRLTQVVESDDRRPQVQEAIARLEAALFEPATDDGDN